MFVRFQRPTLPTKSPHVSPSSSFSNLSALNTVPFPPIIKNRLLLGLFSFLVFTWLLLSHWRAAPSNPDFLPFARKGLKKEVYDKLSVIPWRDLILEPVEVPSTGLSDALDPVPWKEEDLFPIPSTEESPGMRPTSSSADKGGVVVSPPKHRIQVFPRQIVLPQEAPPLSRVVFGIVTTSDRAIMMAELWKRWLTPEHEPEGESPGCLVLMSAKDESAEQIKKLKETLKAKNLPCQVKMSQEPRYEVRVLSMVRELRDYAASIGRTFDWYIFNDDDTFWVDQRAVRRMLAKYDPSLDWMVGTYSENRNQLESFGRMAFGGGGILISDTLMKKLYNLWDVCYTRWRHVFGGDEMITRCSAHAINKTKQTVTTIEPGLNQFDIPGDGTGILQGGLPILSLHHFIGGDWFHLFGYGTYRREYAQITVLKKVVAFLGGDNMFRRYVFGNGHWLLTQGYSLTYYEAPLTKQMLTKVEHTWYEADRLIYPDRPGIPERRDKNRTGLKVKQTFYIDDIVVTGPSSAIFVYVQADKWDENLPSETRVRFRVHWDGCFDGRGEGCEPIKEKELRNFLPTDT